MIARGALLIDVRERNFPSFEIIQGGNVEEIDINVKDMMGGLGNMLGGFLAAFLMMPFSVFGLKSRLDAIEAQLDDVQQEIRSLALRLPEPAPMLPRSLPVMGTIALLPPLWRRIMDRRAAAWAGLPRR